MNDLVRIQKHHASEMNDLTNLYMEAVYMEVAGDGTTCLPDVCLGTLETMIRDLRVRIERKRVLVAAYPEEHIRNAARTLALDRALHLRRLRRILQHVLSRDDGGRGCGSFEQLARSLINHRERHGDAETETETAR